MGIPRQKLILNKITFLIVGSAFIAAILVMRLFQLQVISSGYYQALATKEQSDYVELPAQRGEIIIKDSHSNEEFLLATNTTLNLLYADPTLIKDPNTVAEKLIPIIFNIEEEEAADNERIVDLSKKLPSNTTEEQKIALLKPFTDDELKENFRQNLIKIISEKQRQKIMLASNLPQEDLDKLAQPNVAGIEITGKNVYAYPSKISNITQVSTQIADFVKIPSKKLATLLKGKNRYVILKRKLSIDTSEKIKKLFDEDKKGELFAGIGLKGEYFRYYPEGTLAANLLGYVSRDNNGQYGIESTFNTQLQGITGKFQTKKDSIGRQITVGESVLQPAIDGDDIVLTIDRSVQLKTEQILEEAVKQYQAESGQAIIMNPYTGAIIAMVNYPTFDPNNYGDAFKKVRINFTPEEIKNLAPSGQPGIYYFYTNLTTMERYIVFEEKDENGNSSYFRYKNIVGPEVYHNKAVSWPFEPGSVFKPVVMASAIDDGDVTPNTTFNDAGPIGVDYNKYKKDYDYFIKNALNDYHGLINMTTVIAESLNTGMTFVSKKIGPALFYNYLGKFGFLDRTDIEFDSEITGKVAYYDSWTESELATHAFGQGLTVTGIQLATAYSTLVNGGILIQPHIVEEIRHADGTTNVTETREIRRVISEETSSKIVAMLINSAENGVAKLAQVPGHLLGGKTGTAQTYRHGVASVGQGTTIVSFAGFGPVKNPKFVLVLKLDRPKTNVWCASTAAPTAAKLLTYLFDYYNIPPDK